MSVWSIHARGDCQWGPLLGRGEHQWGPLVGPLVGVVLCSQDCFLSSILYIMAYLIGEEGSGQYSTAILF